MNSRGALVNKEVVGGHGDNAFYGSVPFFAGTAL